MSDITLCVNKACPMRTKCKRATSEPDEIYQSYSDFELNEDGTCEYFLKGKL